MAIKVTVGEQKPQNKDEFPKLMISDNGRIVCFVSSSSGFLLNEIDGDSPHYSNIWQIENFTDYNGSITLQNEQ